MSRPAKKKGCVKKSQISPEFRRNGKFSIFCKGKKWKYLGPACPLFCRKLSAGFTTTRFDRILKKKDNQASFKGIKKIKKTNVFM